MSDSEGIMEGNLSRRIYLPYHCGEKQLTGLNAGEMFSAPSSAPLLLALIGMEKYFLKRKESISTRDELFSFFFLFFFFLISVWQHCLSTSEYSSSSIICVGNMQTISSPSLEDLQSIIALFHFDISLRAATHYTSRKCCFVR